MNKFIPFGRPDISSEDIKEVVATLKSGWIGTGPKTEEFEKEFAKYTRAKYALGVNSCTAGLHLALVAFNISPGDEVITTPLTFCATINVIEHVGAKPVFVDVDDNGLINPDSIEKKITKKTKAIIPVHLYGMPCQMDRIMKIAQKHKLFVIEDAAHAIETWYKKRKIGSLGDVTVFSFYVTKNLTTAEGGMVTSNNRVLIDKMRIFSLHGLSRDAYKRYSTRKFSLYECLMPGFKYNLTDIASALGLSQLKRLDANLKIRQKQWKLYTSKLKNLSSISLPNDPDKSLIHARHLFTILLNLDQLSISRDRFINELINRNIGSGVHFTPVHLHAFYKKKYGYKKGDFPIAEDIGKRTVSLPFGPSYSHEEIRDVVTAVTKLCELYTRKY